MEEKLTYSVTFTVDIVTPGDEDDAIFLAKQVVAEHGIDALKATAVEEGVSEYVTAENLKKVLHAQFGYLPVDPAIDKMTTAERLEFLVQSRGKR